MIVGDGVDVGRGVSVIVKVAVEVYVGKTDSKVVRALKELKGFKKVFAEKGQTVKAEIQIDVNDLAYYDENQHQWVLEKGDYSLYIGNASDNIVHELKISVK